MTLHETVLASLWAKTAEAGIPAYHPLPLHLLDVAASAGAILDREPPETRRRMGEMFGLTWEKARPWLLLVIACHDLGKACPAFQAKWPGSAPLLARSGLRLPPALDTHVNHAFVSQVALEGLLQERAWPEELASLVADGVGCHHGERAHPITRNHLEGDRKTLGDGGWTQARREVFEALLAVFRPSDVPLKEDLTGPDFMLLAGLTSFADWIGSTETWFPFGTAEDCLDLNEWLDQRRTCAERALDAIGWQTRSPLVDQARTFENLFAFPPRPLQEAMAKAVGSVDGPCLLLVEAPMGEGKTEAAFHAHLELQRRFGHRGMYVALPTKATGNAMFIRTLQFLGSFAKARSLDLQLLHGATLLNDTFQNLKLGSIHVPEGEGKVRAGEWFTHRKRALLSEYGVGTVDQALMAILPVRHQFVRMWGLANRVVILDEIHAYDAYTGTLLENLLRWLSALGSSVILLSATLPPSTRRRIARAVGATLPEGNAPYPRLTVLRQGCADQTSFQADPTRKVTIRMEGIPPDLEAVKASLDDQLKMGGMGLALVNTVVRAQTLYRLYGEGEPIHHDGTRTGMRLPDGTEVYLFHARFPAGLRQAREDSALALFGKDGDRSGRKILIATQVAEQSLDLDFDVMVTDLAPVDLVLQRAGRLWRHTRHDRPMRGPRLLVAGLAGSEPPSFKHPLWWGSVYQEHILLRTWILLHDRQSMVLPDEIDGLVQAVYEDEIEVPAFLATRLDHAQEEEEGAVFAYRGLALNAVIGSPCDASWNDPARFTRADDDEPGLHPTLVAQTRLGDTSVVVIPMTGADEFDPAQVPDPALARQWYQRAMSLSRKDVVRQCLAAGVPKGWLKSPLLRNAFPLLLDGQGCWASNPLVRLVEDLGLVYDPKETL